MPAHRMLKSIAALHGACAIILGAFSAHYLAEIIPPNSLANFKLAAQYQIIHALFMLVVLQLKVVQKSFFYVLNLGILFFSGSIYVLSAKIITNPSVLKIIGPITPIGGTLLIFCWIWLSVQLLKNQTN